MTVSTHIENANFLHELAKSLQRTYPKTHKPEQIELLQRLADDELEQAEHVEWVRAKVAAARADTRPGISTNEARARLAARFERFRDAS